MCPWVKNGTPIEDWVVTPKVFRNGRNGKSVSTYDVHQCPMFRLRVKQKRILKLSNRS